MTGEPLINLRLMAHCAFDFDGDSMDGQLSFATLDYAGKKKRTKRDVFLAEMAAAVPWSVLESVMAPHYPKEGPQGGRRAVSIAVCCASTACSNGIICLNPGAEEALYDIKSMRTFCNLELGRDPITDETTILNFRHLLEAHELTKTVFEAVAEYLEARGALLRGGTIVNAINRCLAVHQERGASAIRRCIPRRRAINGHRIRTTVADGCW